jgi:hypothetical protein
MSLFRLFSKKQSIKNPVVYPGFHRVKRVCVLYEQNLNPELEEKISSFFRQHNKEFAVLKWGLKGNSKSSYLTPGDIFFGRIKKITFAERWNTDYDLILDISANTHKKILKLLQGRTDAVVCGIQQEHSEVYSFFVPVKNSQFGKSIDTLFQHLQILNQET